MTEVWEWFLVIGGGLVFFMLVLDSLIRGIKYLKGGKKSVDEIFDAKVRKIIASDHSTNCPLPIWSKQNNENRKNELDLLREVILAELVPMRKDISGIIDVTTKLQHSQMTNLVIKLNELFHNKFDKHGTLSKADQSNWDKYFSDYVALGGNSDIKKMDELIQTARVEAAIDKVHEAKKNKVKKEKIEEEETK